MIPIHFNVAAITARLFARLQIVWQNTALGLSALDSHPEGPATDPTERFVMLLGELPTFTSESRVRAKTWLLGHGFCDAFEAIWETMSCVWIIAEFVKRTHAGTLPPLAQPCDDLESHLRQLFAKELRSFEYAPFDSRFSHLEQQFGVTSILTEQVKTLNRARACLTHRGGLVSAADAKGTAELEIAYDAMVLMVKPLGAAEPVPYERNSVFPVEAEMGIQLGVERRRAFKVGERIELEAHEIQEIMHTLHRFGVSLVESLIEHMKRCGVTILAPSAGDTPAP